ncbi:MAG: hypothetical protein JXA09_03920 [Anaerolineae bacterium]|nr:hypothetical protein [Anaerolineae bacterium]
MSGFRTRRALLLGAVLSLVAVSVTSAVGAPAIDWYVIGSGGGRSEADGYVLSGTIGQAVAGTASAEPYTLCAGFECGTGGISRVYLPLVRRQ